MPTPTSRPGLPDWRAERENELAQLIEKYGPEANLEGVTTAAQLVDRIVRARQRKTFLSYSVIFFDLMNDPDLKRAYAR